MNQATVNLWKDEHFLSLDRGTNTHPAYGRWYKASGSRFATSTVIASSKFLRILIAAFLALCCSKETRNSIFSSITDSTYIKCYLASLYLHPYIVLLCKTTKWHEWSWTFDINKNIFIIRVMRRDRSKCQQTFLQGLKVWVTWVWELSLTFELERSLSIGPPWPGVLTFTNSSARTELMRSLRYL